MAVLLIVFSTILYFYIKYSVDGELQNSLYKQSRFIIANYNQDSIIKKNRLFKNTLNIDVEIKKRDINTGFKSFKFFKKDNRYYLRGDFFYKNGLILTLTEDITQQKNLEYKVFQAIVILVFASMSIILFYAMFLSSMLLAPIKIFAKKIAKMNENILTPLDFETIPVEFWPLAKSINSLVNKIKSFILYKKELFVGAAHELKTPLAVIKTRSQVALIKRNSSKESFEKVIRANIDTVNEMNQMVSAILEFGRAEGAQFEKPQEIDLIEFLKQKIKEFALLARKENKRVKYRLSPDSYKIKIQPLLLTQIIQNLLQNAIRYSPDGGTIRVLGHTLNGRFVLKISDEGPGIDESVDIFAPFVRSKNSPGAGLGLFLVKSATEALGATIEIKNKKGSNGAIATFVLPPYKE
jgi:two-component system OmpR family sensor kinase